MHIAHFDVVFLQIVGERFRHALGERRHEHPAARLRDGTDLREKVVDLPLGGAHRDGGIQKPRRADELFDDLACLFELVGRGRRRNADELRHALVEFLEGERAVVVGRAHAEAVVDEVGLAREVAVIHGADLRDGHVALVDEDEEILGEIIEKGEGGLPGLPPVKVARIVLHARAVPDLFEHFKIVLGALGEALRLQELPLVLERFDFPFEIFLDHGKSALQAFGAHRIVARGEDDGVLQGRDDLARDDVLLAERVDLVAEELDADGDFGIGGGEDLHDVPAHAEGGALEIDVVAGIVDLDEAAQKLVARHLLPGAQRDAETEEFLGRAQTVDAGDGGDDDDVVPLTQRAGRRVAELIDLVIGGRVLFDIGIRRGDIALGLVVVVVGDEVLHAVFGEKSAEFVAQLRRERLVVRNDERGTPHVFNGVRHCKRLAAARNAHEDLRADAVQHALGELFDRLRLIAGRRERRFELKIVMGITNLFHTDVSKRCRSAAFANKSLYFIIIKENPPFVKREDHEKSSLRTRPMSAEASPHAAARSSFRMTRRRSVCAVRAKLLPLGRSSTT